MHFWSPIGRNDVISGIKFKKFSHESVRVVEIFGFTQHIRDVPVQLVTFAMKRLIVTRLIGVKIAVTSHELQVALIGWALRVHVVGC